MSEERARERNARGLERFMLFTDAVVAIAITLLILPVVDALTEDKYASMKVLDIIRENQSHLWSFLLSFFVIAGSWMSHRQTFEGVTGYNSALVWTGLVWLLTIVFLPFTTGLIAQHGDDQATAVLYIANVALSSACLTASVILLARNPGLQDDDIPIGRDRILDAGKQTLLMVIAMLVALLIPPAGFSSLFVLPVGNVVLRLLHTDSG